MKTKKRPYAREKLVCMALLFSGICFAEFSSGELQNKWREEEKVEIMRQQLELQRRQLQEMQTQAIQQRGMQNQMMGRPDSSALELWRLYNLDQ